MEGMVTDLQLAREKQQTFESWKEQKGKVGRGVSFRRLLFSLKVGGDRFHVKQPALAVTIVCLSFSRPLYAIVQPQTLAVDMSVTVLTTGFWPT
jgi:hypothetical protein